MISKLPNTGHSIFSIMTALANQHSAINLSQGFPDFEVAPELIDLIYSEMKKGNNQYAPMPGLLSLREVISNKITQLYQHTYNPETEITITAGGTQALYTAICSIVHSGDEVIYFEPAYDSYRPAIELSAGVPVPVALHPPDFRIPWHEVASKINPSTRLIIINTPHNPTGTILDSNDLNTLAELVSNTSVTVLGDEVYEHIVFDNQKHHSLCTHPELTQRSLLVYSFGKTFHATGWKIGYIAGPAQLMNEFRKVHQYSVFSVNTPMQFALSQYLSDKKNYQQVSKMYEEKRDLLRNLISDSAFTLLPCQGSYFQLLSYENLSVLPDTEYAKYLTINHKLASVPVSVFYSDRHDYSLLRFCFAKRDETIRAAAEILNSINPYA